jgi:hypothetical protein
LLIDLDPQALLSQYLGIPVSELEASVYSVMRGDTDLGRVTRGTEPAEEAANERKEEESPSPKMSAGFFGQNPSGNSGEPGKCQNTSEKYLCGPAKLPPFARRHRARCRQASEPTPS